MGEKGKRGRVPVPDHLRRKHTLHLRVSADELAEVRAAAQRDGRTLSDYLRRRALGLSG